jgi:hypothetical protein
MHRAVTAESPYRDGKEAERAAEQQRQVEAAELSAFGTLVRPRVPWGKLAALLALAALAATGLTWRHRQQVLENSRRLASPEECTLQAKNYHKQSLARQCSIDNDCVAEQRGNYFTKLDGCLRVRQRDASTRTADTLAQKWLDRGCASDFRTCAPNRGAMCEEGRCVERTPNGVPRSWGRLEFPGVMVMFAPKDFVEQDLAERGEEGGLHVFASPRASLTMDVYRGTLEATAPLEAPQGTTVLDRKKLDIEGTGGQLMLTGAKGTFKVQLHINGMDAPGYKGFGRPWISIRADATCREEAPCRELAAILGSIETWEALPTSAGAR